jgi:hypothetical protein
MLSPENPIASYGQAGRRKFMEGRFEALLHVAVTEFSRLQAEARALYGD